MLNLMNAHLQEIKCNKRPFGGVSVTAVGNLYQLKDGYIFQPLQYDSEPLVTKC